MKYNNLHQSNLSTKAKNSLTDYYWFVLNGKKKFVDIRFIDFEPMDLNKLSILRNVGVLTVKEVQLFFKENNLPYKPIKKPFDNRKNKRKKVV